MFQQLKGLKFPDEMIVKFFFKNQLGAAPGQVLELGCANGCNLQLFADYGYTSVGVDLDDESINHANFNFELCQRSDYQFFSMDMQAFVEKETRTFDIVLFPSSLYYLPRTDAISCLESSRRLLKPGSRFFFRMRTPEDYRYQKGTALNNWDRRIDFSETGEKGATISFFEAQDFMAILKASWNPKTLTILKIKYENLQNGQIISNDDFIVWGQI